MTSNCITCYYFKNIGVIAQEVEQIMPFLVGEDSAGYKTVAYQNMVGLLIEAIKEQNEQIKKLQHFQSQ